MAARLVSRVLVDVPRRPCMDDDDYAEWTHHNRLAKADGVASPCADCLLPFALEMRGLGRCDGTPGWRRGAILSAESTLERPVYVMRPNPRRDRAMHLHEMGFRQAEIARALGVSKSCVSRYLLGRTRRLSLEQVRERMRERQQAAKRLRAEGLSVVAIGERLGVSETMTRRYLEDAA